MEADGALKRGVFFIILVLADSALLLMVCFHSDHLPGSLAADLRSEAALVWGGSKLVMGQEWMERRKRAPS